MSLFKRKIISGAWENKEEDIPIEHNLKSEISAKIIWDVTKDDNVKSKQKKSD